MNKIDLVRRIADLLGDLIIEGTADAADGGSITDQELTFPLADQPRGFGLYIHTGVTGTTAGQSAIIASFNTASFSAVVVPSFSAQPTVGDQYFVFKENKWNTYSRLVDMAVQRGTRIFHKPYMATMSIVATQYEYPVPSGFKYLNRLMLVPSGTTDYSLDNRFEIPRRAWVARLNQVGTFTITFDRRLIDLDNHANAPVHVHGVRGLPTLSTPTSNWEGPEDYIINHALMHLCNRNMAKGEGWLERYHMYRNEVTKLEQHYTHLPADLVKVEY